MDAIPLRGLWLPCALVALLFPTWLAAQPQYEVEVLGLGVVARALNESGTCVGWTTEGGNQRAWVAGPSSPLALLPLPPGMTSSDAHDVNDAGQVVGAVSDSFTAELGFAVLWTPDGAGGYAIELLGALPGQERSVATAINDVGDIAGFSITPGFSGGPPVLFTAPGGVLNLLVEYGFNATPADLNDQRQVVGGQLRLNLADGSVDDLGIPPGSFLWTRAYAINENGQVAGYAQVATAQPDDQRAARYTDGVGWELLDAIATPFASAYGINDQGDVIFEVPTSLYVDGTGSFPLETLIPEPGWEILEAAFDFDLNNAGQIVAIGQNNSTGEGGVVLLTPIGSGFRRGDANGDGSYDIADAVLTLEYLFSGAALDCEVAADSNDDEAVDVSDAVYTLQALFDSGPLPAPPFPECGVDPSPGGLFCSDSGCP